MVPYTRAWPWTAFIPERLVSSAGSFHCLPSSSAPRRILSLPWSCCSSLAPFERGQWLLHHSRYWHIMRFNPFGESEARKHLSAWLLIMLPLPRDIVVISLLHGLGCLSPVWTQSMMAAAAAVAWLLPFEWSAGTPEVERSGPPPQVGLVGSRCFLNRYNRVSKLWGHWHFISRTTWCHLQVMVLKQRLKFLLEDEAQNK